MIQCIKSGIKNIFRKKLRSLLTISGVAIGVVSVLIISSIGDIGKYTINQELESVGIGGLALGTDKTVTGKELGARELELIRSQRPVNLDNVEREEVGYVDIELPDIQGVNQKLSALAPGNIVLLNFTAYMSEWSPALNMALGELYVEYHDKGLEVYQVSLDGDVHFWKNAASNLPWTCDVLKQRNDRIYRTGAEGLKTIVYLTLDSPAEKHQLGVLRRGIGNVRSHFGEDISDIPEPTYTYICDYEGLGEEVPEEGASETYGQMCLFEELVR